MSLLFHMVLLKYNFIKDLYKILNWKHVKLQENGSMPHRLSWSASCPGLHLLPVISSVLWKGMSNKVKYYSVQLPSQDEAEGFLKYESRRSQTSNFLTQNKDKVNK